MRHRPPAPGSDAPSDGVLVRNPGTALDLDLVSATRVNGSAVERRVARLPASRPHTKEWQAAWLLRAVTCMDLTTLSGDDTPGTVRRLCDRARQPIRAELLAAVDMGDVTVGAVCVYHAYVATAVQALRGTRIPVAAVSAGFPHGLSPLETRVAEIRASVADGASEIDAVITRAHVLLGDWQALYDEVRAFRDACGDAHLKTILAVGELGTLTNVARASLVAMMAGSDFIKTSTGKETSNATLASGLVMARMIREYHARTGSDVGLKPAGGIRTARQALDWLLLMKEELGDRYLRAQLFRFGASGLLVEIEQQLEQIAAGLHHVGQRQVTV